MIEKYLLEMYSANVQTIRITLRQLSEIANVVEITHWEVLNNLIIQFNCCNKTRELQKY